MTLSPLPVDIFSRANGARRDCTRAVEVAEKTNIVRVGHFTTEGNAWPRGGLICIKGGPAPLFDLARRAFSLCRGAKVRERAQRFLDCHGMAMMPSDKFFSSRPLYLQVRDALAELIASGTWKPGSSIAGETDLARELGVSSGTVRKALNLMVAERLITRRQGRGTFVADPTSDELAIHLSNLYGPDGDRLGGRTKSVEITGGTANALECARLHLCASDAVYRIRRILERKDQIYMVEDAMLPAAFFPGLSDKKLIADNVSVLAREYGILVGKAEERVSLGLPPAALGNILGVPSSSTVMVLDRVVFMLGGRPLEWWLGHCHLQGSYYLARMT